MRTAPYAPPSSASPSSPVLAEVNVAVSTDQGTYWAADTVRIAVTATNTAVTLHFEAGLRVAGEEGPFYYVWTLMPTELTLAPGEAHTWGDDCPGGRLGCYDYLSNNAHRSRTSVTNRALKSVFGEGERSWRRLS